jgi:hypothetical protein
MHSNDGKEVKGRRKWERKGGAGQAKKTDLRADIIAIPVI